MKKLGFGMMRLPHTDPNDASTIDLELTNQLVDAFISKGFTYFDTAWMYNAFASETAAKAALVQRHPRDSFTLATKLHAGFINTKEDRDRIFNEQLQKTGATFFDYYLLHGIEDDSIDKFEQLDCFNWLLDKQKKGLVKTVGFSYHAGAELLDRILTEHPQMQFVQLQINYLDWESNAIQSRACYEVAVKHNVPVIVMEPVKGGTLARMPKKVEEHLRAFHPDWTPASWAIRFVAGLENVMVVLSGMNDMAQLLDNTKAVDELKPLTADEQRVLREAVELINSDNAIPCTGCAYCVSGCPQKIAIPQYFSLYNADKQEAEGKGWHPQGTYYNNLAKNFGKASDCIGCGQCEGVCPQHLPIIRHLQEVADYFEK